MAADVERTLQDLIARVRRVRRWLVAISALRSAAAGLAFVSLYVGVYALLDHHVRFGWLGRVAAFTLFAVMMAGGLYYVIRVLRREMTYAHAANYIESQRSFDQQLVAAVEYYEGRSNYPYSEVLARQLVQQVHQAAVGYRFDATVPRWQGCLLAGFALLCLVVVGLFVRQNVLFVSAYLARLLRPFSEVQPVTATALDATTGDVIAPLDTPVTLTAAVQGRAPESAALVVTRREPNDATDPAPSSERIEAHVTEDAAGNTTLAATVSFDTLGQYEYRFETPDASSPLHTIRVCEPPAIKSIAAQITPPARNGAPPLPPYDQQVTDRRLKVLPGSRVELQMQATKPLREASVTPSNGQPSAQQAGGRDSFTYGLTADQASSLKVDMVSTDGLGNSAPQEVQITLKSDEPPQFKLVCPEGDYLATDVASVPITFEVRDDFGLTSARLYCVLPGRNPTVLESAIPHGARQLSLTYILELEQHDLHVGDSVLFYATATDIDSGQRTSDANAASEIYFIEIRPHQQYWHPQPGGPSNSQPGPVPEDLIALLEYTRALLKKTWTLARAPQTAAEDRPRYESLGVDVRHCAGVLAKTRDDPDAGFRDSDKATINQILGCYEQAGEHLNRRDAHAALPPEENAYRALRKFIDELHLKWTPPQVGASAPQQTPERVQLQEQPPQPESDQQRIESQLREMQQKIDALTRQQQSLKSDLTKALQPRQQTSPSAGQALSQSSSPSGSEGQSSPGQSQAQREQQTSQDANGPATQNGLAKSEGQESASEQGNSAPSNTPGQSGSSGQGRSGTAPTPADAGDPAGSQGSSPGAQGTESRSPARAGSQTGLRPADLDARLRMLQARQRALREQVAQLDAELGQLSAAERAEFANAQTQAQEHLRKAVEAMKQFEAKVAEGRYGSPTAAESADMAAPADSAARRLADAGRAIQRRLSSGDEQANARTARELAEQLAQDADAYDESLSDAEKKQMLDRLEAAKKLLESMAGPQWGTVGGRGVPGMGHVYTNDAHTSPAQTARMLARQFWSVTLEARQHQSRPLEDEPSDVEFFEAENEFFESAAQFGRQRTDR